MHDKAAIVIRHIVSSYCVLCLGLVVAKCKCRDAYIAPLWINALIEQPLCSENTLIEHLLSGK